jgi:hypothetical protein
MRRYLIPNATERGDRLLWDPFERMFVAHARAEALTSETRAPQQSPSTLSNA